MVLNISKTVEDSEYVSTDATHQKKQCTSVYPKDQYREAFLFIAYASTIPEIIPDSLQLNGYADDHSLRKSFKPGIIHEPTNNTNIGDETCTIAVIEDTMLKVKTWMDAVCLKLNESKTEFIYFGSRQQLTKCHHNTININSRNHQ